MQRSWQGGFTVRLLELSGEGGGSDRCEEFPIKEHKSYSSERAA